jgi:hypothetical protein
MAKNTAIIGFHLGMLTKEIDTWKSPFPCSLLGLDICYRKSTEDSHEKWCIYFDFLYFTFFRKA